MIAEKEIHRTSVKFETVVCPICGSSEKTSCYEFSDTFGSYSLVSCKSCNMNYLNPRPTYDTIGVYYDSSNYTPFLSSGKKENLFNRVYRSVRNYSVAWKRRKIEKFIMKGSVLDIGCGTGEFLNEMRANGWAVMGLEPSEDASEFARRELKLDVMTGFIDETFAHSIHANFDVITLWHVLEHVHEPKEALTLIAKKMADAGLLMIAVPNIASLDARIYRKDWIALDVPRHLLHFAPETMEKLVKESGMMIIKKHQMPLDTVFNSLMSEIRVIRRSPKWLLPLFLIRLSVTIICSWFNGIRENRGSSVMYYIRKKKN